jgi:hypothetical protein
MNSRQVKPRSMNNLWSWRNEIPALGAAWTGPKSGSGKFAQNAREQFVDLT